MATGTTVDQLIVEIRAETAGLRKGLDQVNTKLGRTNKTAAASVLTFSRLAKVFAAVGFTRLIAGVVKTSRTFEDLRATIQANTGSVKETSDAFKLILDFTKTTTFQIEDVTRAFIEFRRLGLTATREQLQGIGNVAAAQNVGIDQMAAAIFKASTTSIESLQQLGFAGKSEGSKITLSFGSGAKKIEETMEKTTENVLNFVKKVGEVNFATALEERLKTLSGALSNLGDKTSIFQNQIGEAGLNKSLVVLAGTFQELLDAGGETGLSNLLGELLSGAVNALNSALLILNENTGKVKVAMTILMGLLIVMAGKAVFASIVSGVGSMAVAFGVAAKAATGLRIAMQLMMMTAMLNPIGAALVLGGAIAGGAAIYAFSDEISAAMTSAGTAINNAIESSFASRGDPSDANSDAFIGPRMQVVDEPNKKTNAVVGRLKNLGDLKKEIENVTVRYTDMAKVQELLNEGVAAGTITQEAANATYRDFLTATGPFGKAMAQIGSAVEGLAKSFSVNLTNALMEGQSALATFRDFARNVVAAVISSFMELLVIQPIVDAILGAFSISAPKGGTGGSGARPPMAGGGTVSGRSPVLVGERGPEIFVPNSGGTIMNNMNSKNAMGGGGTTIINQSINFATGVVPTVRAEVMKMMPQIAEVTKGAVAEAAMRGGNYRRMLQGG
jgi:hypothetical protein